MPYLVMMGDAIVGSERTPLSPVLFLKVANIFFGIAYISFAIGVVLTIVSGEVDWLGGTVLSLFLVVQSYGHVRIKIWAMKVTAVLLGAANIFAIFYLVPSYEPHLVAALGERLLKFFGITIVTVFAILIYWLSSRKER